MPGLKRSGEKSLLHRITESTRVRRNKSRLAVRMPGTKSVNQTSD